MQKSADIILKPGRDKPVRHRHPWLFSGAIGHIDGAPSPGEVVRVLAANGEFLSYAYINRQSQITLRNLSWNENETIDAEWWTRAIHNAFDRRLLLTSSTATNSYRLVHSEADGVPGLIVDRYADFLVCQFLTAGIERVRPVVVDALDQLLRPTCILDLSDNDIRKLEGLPESVGSLKGEAPTGPVEILENGFCYEVDVQGGQKTGFYLDQRPNRLKAAAYAQGRRVLDCFCYSGGFTLPILSASPLEVVCLDSSAAALQHLQTNLQRLKTYRPSVADGNVEIHCVNVFEELRKFRDQSRQFDMIVLDPPKLAASQSQVARAMRAYKDLNLLAMKLLSPGGVLVTFSCSGAVSRAAFQDVMGWAATDAKRRVQIIEQLSQGEDHPVLVSFPESEYLKGLICRVD